jgi:hypothetical protein
MAPKITPEILTVTSRFLKTIKNFRGTNAELGSRIAAGRASVVNAGGADAGEFFDILMKALGLPLSLLPGGCAKAGGRFNVSVIAYAGDVPTVLPPKLEDAVDDLARSKENIAFYGFPFSAGNIGSLTSRLAEFGKGGIDDLFVIGHGYWGMMPKRWPYVPLGVDEYQEFYFLGELPVTEIVRACAPYLSRRGPLELIGCDQEPKLDRILDSLEEELGINIKLGPRRVCENPLYGAEYLYEVYGVPYEDMA